jgi:tetratricopeptide (TPR) repeat protein
MLSRLFGSVGNWAERKRLVIRSLALERERGNGNGYRVARTLRSLSNVNRRLGLYKEGIQQAEEALEIFKRLGSTLWQASCLSTLAWLFIEDRQLDAAKDATLRQINLLPKKGQEFQVCQSHRILGHICYEKGENEQAIPHFKTALKFASAYNWHGELFSIHEAMARLFRDEDKFDDANSHIEQAKSHTANNAYLLGRGMETQAGIWRRQRRPEDARSEVLGALKIHEGLGGGRQVERCRKLFREIEGEMGNQNSGKADPNGEFSSNDLASSHPANPVSSYPVARYPAP